MRPEIIFRHKWLVTILGKIKIPNLNVVALMMDHEIGINKNQADIVRSTNKIFLN